jgi:hypothetical protein
VHAWESGDFDDFVELLATDAVIIPQSLRSGREAQGRTKRPAVVIFLSL